MSRLRRGSRTAVEGDSDSMKLLFDQNLSHRLVTMLAPEFAGSRHVRDWGMADAADPVVWAHATQEGFVIVSKDSDFQQRAVLLGHPPKVVWIRLGNCSTHVVSELLRVRLPICWPSKPIRSHRFLLFHDFGSVRLCPIVSIGNNRDRVQCLRKESSRISPALHCRSRRRTPDVVCHENGITLGR